MKPEKGKNICSKCKQSRFCDSHHILPKGLFGEGETTYLCKTCHDEFHRFLGHKNLKEKNKQPIEFYLQKWFTWLYLSLFLAFLWVVFG